MWMNLRLLTLLDQAKELSAQFSGGYSGEFFSAEEFHDALSISIDKLKQGDTTQLRQLYTWFLPTSCWDDFVGQEGQDMANEICSILSNILPR